MFTYTNTGRPILGQFTMADGQRWPILRGDWSNPPKRAPSKIKRLCIYGTEGIVGQHLEVLALFPQLHSIRLALNAPLDLAGLYHLTRLKDLWLSNSWFPASRFPALDLSRLPKLRRLSTPFFAKLRGLETLKHLTDLQLSGVCGTKELDFRFHRRLKELHLGPANGVSRVRLDGLTSLRCLTFAGMRNLTSITGTEFYDTVTRLDIRASHSIPASTLARFRQLKSVVVGMKSTVMPINFPLCAPLMVALPG